MSEQPSSGAGAVRMIFEYEGDQVRLVSQSAVDVEIPRFAATEQRAEHFVEVRDDRGDVLSRVPVRGGFAQSAEIFPEDHNEPITRVDTEARGAFTVVVPARREAARVAVMRSGRPPVDVSRAPTPTPGGSEDMELANFPLER